MTPADIAGLAAAGAAIGGGLYKLGSGLTSISITVKDLVKYHEDHEQRLRALEQRPRSGRRQDTVR